MVIKIVSMTSSLLTVGRLAIVFDCFFWTRVYVEPTGWKGVKRNGKVTIWTHRGAKLYAGNRPPVKTANPRTRQIERTCCLWRCLILMVATKWSNGEERTSWWAINYKCIFVVRTLAVWFLLILINTLVVHADNRLFCLPSILLGHIPCPCESFWFWMTRGGWIIRLVAG